MEQPVKRGPGRPPKRGEAKRAPFMTRIRESLRDRLQEQADQHGRSLSEEIETRLEDSFDGIEKRFGGKTKLNLAITLLSIFDYAGQQRAALAGHKEWTTSDWLADRECFEAALERLVRSLWEQRPDPGSSDELFDWLRLLTVRERARRRSGWVKPEPADAPDKAPEKDAA